MESIEKIAAWQHTVADWEVGDFYNFYAPNFEKVGGHIGFGLSVRMYVFMFEISS